MESNAIMYMKNHLSNKKVRIETGTILPTTLCRISDQRVVVYYGTKGGAIQEVFHAYEEVVRYIVHVPTNEKLRPYCDCTKYESYHDFPLLV